MELAVEQRKAMNIAIERYLNGEQYTVIAGVAGSGKSTCVKFIISALAALDDPEKRINPSEDVIFTSFTGKATLVLAQKGNKNTSTLHKLLYKSHPHPTKPNTYINLPKDVGEIKYKIVVVDEIGMVPMELMQMLAKHPCYVLCLGDSNQLPPVMRDRDNHLLDNPHAELTEVHRQAGDSGILKIATDIRLGRLINADGFNDVKVFSRDELTTGMLQWADQCICATNATKDALNEQMRKLQGKNGAPQDGDKIICNRNYWEYFDNEGNALVNGTIGYIRNSFEVTNRLPKNIIPSKGYKKKFDVIHMDFETETGTVFKDIEVDKRVLEGGEPSIDWKTQVKIRKRESSKKDRPSRSIIPLDFSYANVISCHRSQGSSWEKVLVVEERFPYAKDEHQKWLYTAVTRAEKRLVIIKI